MRGPDRHRVGRHRSAAGRRPPAGDALPGARSRRELVLRLRITALLLLPLAIGVSIPPREVPGEGRYAGPPGDWHQVFAEEFEGPALDPAIWHPNRYGGGDGDAPFNPPLENAWFSPENVTVDDGRLVITTSPEPRTFDDHRYEYSSGVVQTTPDVALRPVQYIEARIRFPRCEGCWPAFWLHPLDRWPPEIDVAEFLESGSESRPSFNYISPEEKKTGPDMYGDPDVDYREEFHTYGVLWDGARAVPYLDGVPFDAVAAQDVTGLPMMIIVNLSVRRGFRPPSGTQLLVDWVRVWEPTVTSG
ncbi:glycoside hydrolase family 16 protein [Blastococcus deserti]|uniref:Family 16 glycosylhydrolase n=1 Tax=Blastococcus deserti TaxID=2259033 RepID=A0ABW4X815_9ACTN